MEETITLSRDSYDKLNNEISSKKNTLDNLLKEHVYYNGWYAIESCNEYSLIKSMSSDLKNKNRLIEKLEKENETLKKNIFLRIKKAFYSRFK